MLAAIVPVGYGPTTRTAYTTYDSYRLEQAAVWNSRGLASMSIYLLLSRTEVSLKLGCHILGLRRAKTLEYSYVIYRISLKYRNPNIVPTLQRDRGPIDSVSATKPYCA